MIEMLISYPEKISKYFEMVINDYTLKPDNVIWNNLYANETHDPFTDFAMASKSDYFIWHQFYKILQREDLEKMYKQLISSKDNVFCVALFPKTLDSINTHTTEKDEGITHGDGTAIFKTKMLKKVIELERKNEKYHEYHFINAINQLGFKVDFAPYVREWYIEGHEMISSTRHPYFIPMNW